MNKTGFGFLRLPRLDQADEKSIDYPLLNAMVDRFLALGGTYFDTAYTYLGGISEEAIRKALVERHPRSSFILADKLPGYQLKTQEEAWVYFEESCRRCGVDSFDVYLLHWLNDINYEIAEKLDQFGFLRQLKAEGKAGRIGFSYHDGPELLDRILTAHPEVDIVQLQINYLDWDSVSLQAAKCYDVALRHGKSVVVMEPVKGGTLVNLPTEGRELLAQIRPQDTTAAWAIRFATNLSQVETVLSGMNTMAQIEDNLQTFSPMTQNELDALNQVAQIIRSNTAIGCTGCSYCVPHCPISMPIPRYFALYNDFSRNPGDDWKMLYAYDALAKNHPRASDCLTCRKCEENCPQKLPITEHLASVAKAFP